MKELLASLEALFLQFNIRRLFYWVFVAVFIIGGLYFGERVTGYVFQLRMQKQVTMLKDLHDLSKDGIAQNPELNSLYEKTVNELNSHQVGLPPLPQITFTRGILQFLIGGSIGILTIFYAYFRRSKNQEWVNAMFGGIVYGALTGAFGVLIEPYLNPWVYYLGYPTIQLVFLLFAVRRQEAKNQEEKNF